MSQSVSSAKQVLMNNLCSEDIQKEVVTMDWMIGKHYKLCDADWNVRFEGEITNVSELAIEIQQSTTRLTIPLAIYSRLIAIEEGQPKKSLSPKRTQSKTEASMEESSRPRLLTEKQVAELIGISRSFLRQSRMEGHRQNRTEAPPFIKVGRAVRYKHEDIERWIENQIGRTQ